MIKSGKFTWPVNKTLFHELAHITDENQREDIKSREMLQRSLVGQFGRYYEWTNTIFERLAVGDKFYKKNDAMQLSNSGYEALAPLGSMLACALGMPEIEFAKIKDKGRDYETKLLESMFPSVETDGSKDVEVPYGSDVLEKVKNIFNKYDLDVSSLGKKRVNQNLLNELYVECLEIMKRRIENEVQSGSIENSEKYRKYQMFYLKKMNFNFKSASKSDGFRFLRAPIIHDIGFCNDQISRDDLLQVAQEHIAMTEFGFDDSTLGKYSKVMTLSKDKKSFDKTLKVSRQVQIVESKEELKKSVNDEIVKDENDGEIIQS